MIWLFISPLIVLLFYATRRWPGQAIILSSALVPFYLLRLTMGGIPTNLFEVIVVTQVAAFLSAKSLRWALRNLVKQVSSLIIIAILLFVGAATIGVVVSSEPRVSLGILKGWIIIPILYATLVASVLAAKRMPTLAVIYSLIYSGAGTAALSLLLWNPPGRVAGIYDVPNSLAMWLAPLLVMAVWQVVTRSQEYDFATQGALYASVGLMVAALLATQSVTSIGAVIVALLLGAIRWLPSQSRRRLLQRLAVYSLLVLLLLTVTGRLAYFIQPLRDPTTHSSLSVRQQLWSVSLELLQKSPVWGVGLGQFEPHYQTVLHHRFAQYNQESSLIGRPPIAEFVFRDPHNLLLSLWLNLGIAGLISFAALTAHVIYRGFRFTVATQQGALLGVVTTVLLGLADTPYWKNDLAVLYWLLIAAALVSVTKVAPST